MRFKRVKKVTPKSVTPKSKRSFKSPLHYILKSNNLSLRQFLFMNLLFQSGKIITMAGYLKVIKDLLRLWMIDFVWASSLYFQKRWFYGIQGTTMATDFSLFIKFLQSFVKIRSRIYESNQMLQAVLIMNNVSIHKSSLVKIEVEKLQLSLLTITPYSTALNLCEKLILTLKAILRAKQAQEKVVCLKAIASIVNEIKQSQLKDFIKAS